MRKPSVAGVFYKASPLQLKKQVQYYLSLLADTVVKNSIQAIIVPHAAYEYSGEVAAAAYKQLDNLSYENVFLIGTSHNQQFSGAALYTGTGFKTPLGEMAVNSIIVQNLMDQSPLFYDGSDLHEDEHCLEVQLPFVQTVLQKPSAIVPLLIGTNNPGDSQVIASHLRPYFNLSNLFIISTDFSHYPSAEVALFVDEETADVIVENQAQALLNTLQQHKTKAIKGLLTDLCGWSAVLTLLYLSNGDDTYQYHKLLYQHSGDKMQMKRSRVVGYHAMALTHSTACFTLDEHEKRSLLQWCHYALCRYWQIKADMPLYAGTFAMKAHLGAFVSVYLQGELCGCIGYMSSHTPLYKLVQKLVVEAAFNDKRFKAPKKRDVNEIRIEISVLTPLVKVASSNAIEVGKHGIYVKKGLQSGTFLPQVGERNRWTAEEFLGHCSRDKAKIGWDGWRSADVFTYEAIVFTDDE